MPPKKGTPYKQRVTSPAMLAAARKRWTKGTSALHESLEALKAWRAPAPEIVALASQRLQDARDRAAPHIQVYRAEQARRQARSAQG